MTVDARFWRVGIIGVNPVGLFLLELINLHSKIRVVGAFDRDPSRLCFASQPGCEFWDRPGAAFEASTVDVVLLMGCDSADTVADALRHGKHVVLDAPWLLSSSELRSLHEQSQAAGCVATVATVRRASADFASALSAKQTGRLGMLRSMRVASCEQCLPMDEQSTNRMREIGFQWLEQLLVLVESTPRHMFARRFRDEGQSNEFGFLATIEFTSGCIAQVEIRTRTRLSERTGWMLEGLAGSYRGDRLFTTTPDGEIVDEALHCPDIPNNVLIEELVSAWRKDRSTLPSLADAARVVQLIENLERSADSGHTVFV